VAQERAIIMLIGLLGLAFLFFTLLIGGTTNSVFLTTLEHVLAILGMVYNWLVEIIAAIIVIVVIPIFWLISLLHPSTQLPKVRRFNIPQSYSNLYFITLLSVFLLTIII